MTAAGVLFFLPAAMRAYGRRDRLCRNDFRQGLDLAGIVALSEDQFIRVDWFATSVMNFAVEIFSRLPA
jgi:hypothetical protein